MKTKLLIVLLSFSSLLFGSSAFAQGVVAGQGGSTAIHPDSMQGGSVYGYYMGTDAQGVAGGSLLGSVTVAGDPLMWDPVPINVSCLGKIVFTTFADPKGNFRISAVNANGALSMQGDAKRQMETHFEGCTVSSSLTGFTSSSITLTHRNFRDAPDIGTITLSRSEGAKGTALSTTSESISPKAIKLFEKARSDWMAQNQDHVVSDLKKAVEIDSRFAEAWYQLGKLEQATKPDEAREDYAKAIATDPRFIRPYEQLLILDSQEGKWKNSLTDAGQALRMNPRGTPQIWYAYAEGILKAYAAGALPLEKLKIAETSAQNSLALDPQHMLPNTEQLLALILTQEKNYVAAIDHLRNSLTYAPSGADTDKVKAQIAQLEQLKSGNAK